VQCKAGVKATARLAPHDGAAWTLPAAPLSARPPAHLPVALTLGGPAPPSARSCGTRSTPGTWCSAAPASPAAAKPGPSRPSSGYGHPSPSTPRSSTRPPGTLRRPSPPNAATPATPRCPPPSPGTIHDQRTRAETQLTDLTNATSQDNDPALLDQLPYLPGILHNAPEHLIEQLAAALNVECLFRKEQNQATIWVTITDSTPATIAALLTDPRADHNQPSPTPPAASPAPAVCGELEQDPMWSPSE
jgi:hypothetical protein